MRHNECNFFKQGHVVDLATLIEDATIVQAYGKYTGKKPIPYTEEYYQARREGFIYCTLGGLLPVNYFLMVKPSKELLAYWQEKVGYSLHNLTPTKMADSTQAKGCYQFTASEETTGITRYQCGYLTNEVFEGLINELLERMP